MFNSDPLIDYRSQRPLMNYKDGRLVDMRRSGIVLSHASDVEGQPFLHLHGAEPDFQWDALLADMIDIIEKFGVKSTFSFTAVPSATPHTRPADMVVRTADKREDPVSPTMSSSIRRSWASRIRMSPFAFPSIWPAIVISPGLPEHSG